MYLLDAFKNALPQSRVHEHVNVFLKTPDSIYLGHIPSAAVLIFIASGNPRVYTWFLILWGLLELIFYPLLMEIWRRSYTRLAPDQRSPYVWIRRMDGLSFMVGLSWGVMTFVSLNPDNVAHFAIQMSIAAGATAAAVRSLAIFPRSFVLYAVPYLGLLALRLFMLGDEFILLGVLVLIFLLMMLRFGYDVLESVSQYIEISNENLSLAQRYRDAAEAASHANREKTRLLAAASHDLRQPLHAIGLHIETLPTEKMDERSRETLGRIRSSLQTLSKLFNSVLDVSLLDSGKVQVRPTVVDLEDMLNHVLDDYEPLAEIAHVTLMLECPKVGIVGDPILVRRMVQNLLSNAIRHSGGGFARIIVETDGAEVSIAVCDDGPGIPVEHQAVIFEEFTQIKKRSARSTPEIGCSEQMEKGLGLGLAIVRRLADLQKLSIKLDTGPSGTCITIAGLANAPMAQQVNQSYSPSERIAALFNKKRVLVVDDDEETRQATVNLLNAWGCNLFSADSLEQMMQIEGSFDLIISDYSFPDDYTGLDIVREARSKFGQDLKALIISGNLSQNVQHRVTNARLLLIHKPVQPVQLRSAMLDLFSRSSRSQVMS
nr:hybrid sensor histidine kinase/response regulator [uncultured Cohaesibacter sp.]